MKGLINNPILGKTLTDLIGVPSPTFSASAYFAKMIPNFITLALIIGSLVAFFKLLLGAVSWITAGGDKAGLENAQKEITNALVGLAILFSVFGLFSLIELIFGIKLMSINLSNLFIK